MSLASWPCAEVTGISDASFPCGRTTFYLYQSTYTGLSFNSSPFFKGVQTMTQQKTRTATREQEVAGPAADPLEENGGGLRQQAAAFAHVAREAHADCQRGDEAERELQRRRNRSGQ
jgi:hypothetical protein